MQRKINVLDVSNLFEDIKESRRNFLRDRMRLNVQQEVGKYLTKLVDLKLNYFLSKMRHEEEGKDSDHQSVNQFSGPDCNNLIDDFCRHP